GEFSVNGQRTESNYFMVDGVSANFGPAPHTAQSMGATGSIPASTVLGTTQALVSADALQEVRVNTSTYSAEYGRNPGGQFSFTTRAGPTRFPGSRATYVRSDARAANDWFNNSLPLARPPLRQNDTAGTFGGPVVLPGYDGHSRTQFFVSYEGLR